MTQREAENLAKLMDAEISHTVDLDIMHHQAAMLLRSQAVEIKSLKAAQAAVEPVAWAMLHEGKVVDTITELDRVGEMAKYASSYPVPLYTSPPDHTKAMRLALEAHQAFVAYDSGDQDDIIGMMIAYAAALEMAKAAIAALEGALK